MQDLNQYTSTQPLADQLKALISRQGSPDQRREASAEIQRFERCGFSAPIFADAMTCAEGFSYENGRLTYSGGAPIAAVKAVIQRYVSLAEC